MPEEDKELLNQLHRQWRMSAETCSFLSNLNKVLEDLQKKAENLAVTVGSSDTDIRNTLVMAYTLRKKVIEYAQTSNSILVTRTSGS